MTLQIVGGDKITRKLSKEIMRQPMRRFFTKAAIAVQADAKRRAPVDTGRLRSSLTYEIDPAALPLWAKVGTNVSYAPFMEYGTGILSENPEATKKWHFPSAAVLEVWARRHKLNAFEVADTIQKRGGLMPRRYLRSSLKDNQAKIKSYLKEAEAEIAKEWLA